MSRYSFQRLRLILSIGIVSICALVGQAQQWIEDVVGLPLGSVVTVSGTVTSGQEFGDIRYIQDSTAGIGLFGNGVNVFIEGDSIRVTGVLSRYRSALQLSPVFSTQLLATQKMVAPLMSADIASIASEEYTSQKVSLTCVGVASCDDTYEEGWYRFYDSQGGEARLWIGNNELEGMPIGQEPLLVSGIWTQIEGQYEMRAQQMLDVSEGDCYLIPPGTYHFEKGNPVLRWSDLEAKETFLVLRNDSTNKITPLGVVSGEVSIMADTVWPGYIHQAWLRQQDDTGRWYSSLPLDFVKPLAITWPVEILFNRGVDASFSDGSMPFAVGSSAIETDIINRIDDVKYTLDIAMYNTTRSSIVQAITRAAQRGVKVRYIADDETSNSALDGILPFPVKYRSGGGIMHNKFVIADRDYFLINWVWTGSTNFSANQLSQDPNHAIILRDRSISRTYTREFEEMWGNDSTGIAGRTGDVKTDNTAHLLLTGKEGVLYESYFSPSDETNCHILRTLESAQHQALVGLLLLTRDDLTEQLIRLHQSGVDVRVILEDEDSSEDALLRLRSAGVPVSIHDFSSIFHHKYAIIDEGYPDSDPQVISGSHNWTWSADNINDENTVILHDQSVTNVFRQEFEARWEELNPTAVPQPLPEGISIFPQPVSDLLWIENSTGEYYTIELYDLTGRLCLTTDLEPDQYRSIEFSSAWADGMYGLLIKSPDTGFIYRVIRVR